MTRSPVSAFLSAVRAALYQRLPELASRLEFHHRLALKGETHRHGSLFIPPRGLQSRLATTGFRKGGVSTVTLSLLVYLPDVDTKQPDFTLLLHDELDRYRREMLGLLEEMRHLDTWPSGFQVRPVTDPDEGDVATSIDAGCPALVLRFTLSLETNFA